LESKERKDDELPSGSHGEHRTEVRKEFTMGEQNDSIIETKKAGDTRTDIAGEDNA